MPTSETANVANVVFLPWVRQGAAALIPTVDTLGSQPAVATLTATLAINAAAEPLRRELTLLGPGDVLGVSPQDIVRREPPPGSAAFESNHLVGIEFDRPDFPWLFTPARADADARLRPWLCLVVVRWQEGVRLVPATPLPFIEIAAPADARLELPDLAESWLWAHAQVAGGSQGGAAGVRSVLGGDSTLSLSRLLSPRLLTPDTDYIACLVPAFEAGRLAGLGLPGEEGAPLAPAWSAASIAAGPLRLPLYDHWNFHTGAGGDFRTLARLLHAEAAPDSLGKRPIAIGTPGFALPDDFPVDATLLLEGALKPLEDKAPPGWPDATAEPFQSALAAIVNTAVPPADQDPLLAPPLYGRWHAGADAARRPPINWFDELNLDPRHRAVAAFGTRVVQEHQESLMASAWQQAGDVAAANQRLRQLQVGLMVGTSLYARHIDRMDTDALLRLAGPALSRVQAAAGSAAGSAQAPTLLTAFVRTALPLKSLSPAMRKLSRPRGPLNRRLQAVAGGAGGGLAGFAGRLNSATAIFVTPPQPTLATFNAVAQKSGSQGAILGYPQVTRDAVAAMPGAPQFQIVAEGAPYRMPVEGTTVPLQDNPVAVAFRAAALAHLARLDPGRPWLSIFWLPQSLDLGELRFQLGRQMAPQASFVAFADALVPGRSGRMAASPPTPVAPVMFAPTFPQPMYEALRDLSQELLLPGLAAVGANAVVGLKTNPRFVNAYMVGLNFEMGRELLWRGYPTDQRGTCFAQFWDSAASDSPQPDIDPLHVWGERRLEGPAGSGEGRFVMLLRSDLLRRYPGASIYAAPALRQNGRRLPDPDPAHEVPPAFRGALPPDVTFIGFDLSSAQVTGEDGTEGYFIVIQEQPTEPRFGLDPEFTGAGQTHVLASAGPPAGLPLRNLVWGHNAAHLAGILRRLPVRIAIHASQFVPRPAAPAET